MFQLETLRYRIHWFTGYRPRWIVSVEIILYLFIQKSSTTSTEKSQNCRIRNNRNLLSLLLILRKSRVFDSSDRFLMKTLLWKKARQKAGIQNVQSTRSNVFKLPCIWRCTDVRKSLCYFLEWKSIVWIQTSDSTFFLFFKFDYTWAWHSDILDARSWSLWDCYSCRTGYRVNKPKVGKINNLTHLVDRVFSTFRTQLSETLELIYVKYCGVTKDLLCCFCQFSPFLPFV